MFNLLVITIFLFIITNIDDLVVLIAFSGHPSFASREILIGQVLGFGVLVGVSIIGGVTISLYLSEYVRWFGILPIIVGILWYKDIRLIKHSPLYDEYGVETTSQRRIGLVAVIGIINGSDNVSLYVPFFALIGTLESVTVIILFMLLALVWVLFAQWLSRRPLLASKLNENVNIVLPIVLICIGSFIILDIT